MSELQEQTDDLVEAETELNIGPVEMAGKMGTPYQTYKKWRAGQRKMPAVALRCLALVRMTKGAL